MKNSIWIILFSLFNFNLYAQELKIIFDTKIEPLKAIGIVFNKDESKYIHDTNISNENGNLIVTFSISEKLKDSYASALIIDQNKKMHFGRIQDLEQKNFDLTKLSSCESNLPPNLETQESILKDLVDIRLKKKNIQEIRIEKLLTQELQEKIQGLEKEYGFNYSKDLSLSELSPYELNLRLFKTLSSIKSFNR